MDDDIAHTLARWDGETGSTRDGEVGVQGVSCAFSSSFCTARRLRGAESGVGSGACKQGGESGTRDTFVVEASLCRKGKDASFLALLLDEAQTIPQSS